ncbi:MAG: N-acetyltransferase [Actinobacteria bacterium]|nr:N-acetyltransferase [Actinomycetota bacterium]
MNSPTDGRVVLAAFVEHDIPVLGQGFRDPLWARWSPVPAEGDIQEWMSRRNDWSAGDHCSWAIRSAGDGRLLGSISVFQIDRDQRDAEVGYAVLPAERGAGVAAAAVRLAAAHAFGPLGLHRLSLYHAVENSQSCRVAAKAGFTLEGTLRQSYRYADGLHHDEHVHGLLDTDAM